MDEGMSAEVEGESCSHMLRMMCKLQGFLPHAVCPGQSGRPGHGGKNADG